VKTPKSMKMRRSSDWNSELRVARGSCGALQHTHTHTHTHTYTHMRNCTLAYAAHINALICSKLSTRPRTTKLKAAERLGQLACKTRSRLATQNRRPTCTKSKREASRKLRAREITWLSTRGRTGRSGSTRIYNSVTQPTGTPAQRAVVRLCMRHGSERQDGAREQVIELVIDVQSARIADFRGNSTPLPSAGGSQQTNQIQMQ